MSETFEEFNQRREQGNEHLLDTQSLAIKRFVGLDKTVYAEGALSIKSKELLGLSCSLVLRCNDCVDYHLGQCLDLGYSREELQEAFSVALMIGGSIVIPHARHASSRLDELLKARSDQA